VPVTRGGPRCPSDRCPLEPLPRARCSYRFACAPGVLVYRHVTPAWRWGKPAAGRARLGERLPHDPGPGRRKPRGGRGTPRPKKPSPQPERHRRSAGRRARAPNQIGGVGLLERPGLQRRSILQLPENSPVEGDGGARSTAPSISASPSVEPRDRSAAGPPRTRRTGAPCRRCRPPISSRPRLSWSSELRLFARCHRAVQRGTTNTTHPRPQPPRATARRVRSSPRPARAAAGRPQPLLLVSRALVESSPSFPRRRRENKARNASGVETHRRRRTGGWADREAHTSQSYPAVPRRSSPATGNRARHRPPAVAGSQEGSWRWRSSSWRKMVRRSRRRIVVRHPPDVEPCQRTLKGAGRGRWGPRDARPSRPPVPAVTEEGEAADVDGDALSGT